MTIDIDAIRQREQAATPGPWTARTTYPHIVLQGDDEDAPSLISTTLAGDVVEDAVFVAHARTDIPALLDLLDLANAAGDALRNSVDALTAEVSRLRAELAEMKADRDGWRDAANNCGGA